MIQVTSGDRSFSLILCAGCILVAIINMFFVSKQTTFIGLVALVIVLVLIFFYNLHFVDLWISGNKIVLKKFNRIIDYEKIYKLKVLPTVEKSLGGYHTICLIEYINAAGKKTRKLIDIPAYKVALLEELRKIVNG